jgi:hypothetical protein
LTEGKYVQENQNVTEDQLNFWTLKRHSSTMHVQEEEEMAL